MKIDRLDLLAFGPFTATTIDLGSESGGLHLLYGANEAGKSSTLRAISGWLFGIPSRSPDNFVHEYKALRIGGQLRNADGEKLEFLRRKAPKNDLLNPLDNGALPADLLTPFLGGLDRAAFERIWAIDRDELISGGKDLRALKGLAGESLFATALGISGLGQALGKLEEESQQIFVKDGRAKTLIGAASKRHADALKSKRGAETSVGKWTKLQKQLSEARQRQREAGERLKELRSRSIRLSRILTVLEDMGERQTIEESLQRCADVLVLPPEYSVEARRETLSKLAQVSGMLSDTRVRLDGADGLVARCLALEIDEDLLGQELAIEQLQKKAGAYEKACVDLPKRESERQMLRVEAERLLADIDPDLQWDEAERLRLRPSVEAEVNRLGVQHGSLQEGLAGYLEQIRELEIELKAVEDELAGLPASLDTANLERSLREIAAQGDVAQLASERMSEVTRLTTQIEREINRLGLWQGTVQEVDTLQLPLRATVDDFSTRFSRFDDERDRLDQEAEKIVDTIDRVTEEIQRDQGQRQIPTRAQLANARAARTSGWELVRDSWLGEAPGAKVLELFAGDSSLQDAYEEAVAVADSVADGLIDDSELSAKLEQRQQQLESLEAERVALKARKAEWVAREESARKDWKTLWAASEIDKPLTPREMAEWLDGFAKVRSLVEQARQAGDEAARLDELVTDSRARLARNLASLSQPACADGERLAEMLATCHGLVESSAKIERKREQLGGAVRDLRSKLEIRSASRLAAEQDLIEWKAKWTDALAALGCDADTSVDQAADRVRGIRECFAKRDDIDDYDTKRIGPMREDKSRFEQDVDDLVNRCAPDLSETAPRHTAEALAQRLKANQKSVHERALLQERIDEERDSLPGLERQEQEAQSLLSQLCRHAGVEQPEDLAAVEDASQRKLELQSGLAEIDRRLLKVGEGTPVAELIAETQDKSGDDLRAELEDLEQLAESCEQDRDRWTSAVATLAQECDEVEGSADAAAADQEALGHLAEVAQHAEQYLRLRLASNLLRRRIEKHRSENQDPMVALASELFSQITCGSFSGLTLDYDDNEEPTIVGVRGDDGQHVQVDAFSKGTADQLYLALRLAYLQNRLVGEEPMPIILDDILVDFDDRRAVATLEILADLSRRTQVILFTHHEHVRDLARRALDPGVLKECELESGVSALASQSDG